MFILKKQFKFEASHQLPKHDGKCKRLHGHSWVGYVIVSGPDLATVGPKSSMLIDYGDLKKIVEPMVELYLDHHHLNETLQPLENPTSEEIARWCYEYLEMRIPPYVKLESVVIEETCTSSAEYRK